MLLFLKLGGSLITDKAHEQTVRAGVLARLAGEIALARAARPGLRLVLGHGSGSFGHPEGQKHGIRQGVETPDQWRGFAEVAYAAAKLNRHVLDALHTAGIPVLNCPPSASAICHAGSIISLSLTPILAALDHDLVPLVRGDVAIDEARGGTIISTEEVFRYLANRLHPDEILLAGIERGVLTHWPGGEVIPLITPETIADIQPALRGASAADVTGGMESKVLEMLAQAQAMPGLAIRIFSGLEPGLVKRLLLGESEAGTLIKA